MCSVTQQLPTSAVLSEGLEKRGSIALASGGLADVWRGESGGRQVAMKSFRIYPTQNLKEAKEVRTQSAWVAYSRTKFADFMEARAHVEEAIP